MDFQQQHRSKQTKPAQILRHSRRPHTIIKMNDNMGMVCTPTEPGHDLYTNRARAWSVHQQSQGMVCTPTEPGHDLYTNRASGYSYLTDYKLGRYNLLAEDHYVLDKKKIYNNRFNYI
jgi:hypothetical protein